MAILDIGSWEAPPPLVAFERIRPGISPKPSRHLPGATLRPVDVYCYLCARFGRPNGPLMFTVSPSSDNPIQWHYTLISGDEILHVQQVGARVELMASTAVLLTTGTGNSL
jgi:hypothetical protein